MAGGKLSSLEKDTILDWLAQGWSQTEVAKLVKESFDKTVSLQAIDYYLKTYKVDIDKRRDILKAGILDSIPHANRYMRVARLDQLARYFYKTKQLKEYRETLAQISQEMAKVGPLAVAAVVNQNQNVQSQSQEQEQEQAQGGIEGLGDEQAKIIAEFARAFIEHDGDIFADEFVRERIGAAGLRDTAEQGRT